MILAMKTRGWKCIPVENNHIDVFVFEFADVLNWLSKEYELSVHFQNFIVRTEDVGDFSHSFSIAGGYFFNPSGGFFLFDIGHFYPFGLITYHRLIIFL